MTAVKPAATTDKQALADLRAQIDRVDGALHDLLRDRAEIIDQVRKLKGKQTLYIRPGREAQMLRVLTGRPQGKLPEGLVVRLWREMISAFTLQEGGLKAAVVVQDKGPDLWDVARDHFLDQAGIVLLALAIGLAMLGRHHDLGGADGLAVDVANRHLALGVGLQVRQFARAARLAQDF